MKKGCCLLLVLALILGTLPALGEGTRIIADSTGREVEVPAQITRVATCGAIAQYMVFALAPDLLSALSIKWERSASGYLSAEALSLPFLGQLYGGRGEMNLEELLANGPDVVIDIGEPKSGVAEDMERLSELSGIPFLHFDGSLDNYDQVFLQLGELLGRPEEARALAEYCRGAADRVKAVADTVEKRSLIYVTGEEGLNVIAKGSFQAQVIDLLAENAAVLDHPVPTGTGNEVDLEQLMNWDPEVIVFSPDSIFDSVGEDELWQVLSAVSGKNYVRVPDPVQNWMGFPPGCQRFLGMQWLAALLYPDTVEYDLYEQAREYFRLFLHCDLTREAYDNAMENAFFRE